MENIILAFAPFVVAGITHFVKKLGSVNMLSDGYRVALMRLVVAVLSFGSVVGTSILSGTGVEATSVEAFTQAVLVFLGATGAYFFSKK